MGSWSFLYFHALMAFCTWSGESSQFSYFLNNKRFWIEKLQAPLTISKTTGFSQCTSLFTICYHFIRSMTLFSKNICAHFRRGSRINTDRFPKRAPKAQYFRRVRGGGRGSPRKCFEIFTPEVPFPGFPSHLDRILAKFQRRMCSYY